jgi:hypothetical protein
MSFISLDNLSHYNDNRDPSNGGVFFIFRSFKTRKKSRQGFTYLDFFN